MELSEARAIRALIRATEELIILAQRRSLLRNEEYDQVWSAKEAITMAQRILSVPVTDLDNDKLPF